MDITILEGNMPVWPFSGKPHLLVPHGTYKRQEEIDPFPCYAHNARTVKSTADYVNRCMPLDGDLTIINAHYESLGRTNGWMSEGYYYNKDDKDEKDRPYVASIFLSGKRIPPHPAMTRYLVSHEYGHVVQYWIERRLEAKNLRSRYAALRGVGPQPYYGGLTWHASIGEMFANDFRILVCELEGEFWPHEGFTRPDAGGTGTDAARMDGVRKFWTLCKHEKFKEALETLPESEATDGE